MKQNRLPTNNNIEFLRCFEVNLYDGKLAPLEKFPPAGEVFSVDLGSDGLHRAVHNVSFVVIDSTLIFLVQ